MTWTGTGSVAESIPSPGFTIHEMIRRVLMRLPGASLKDFMWEVNQATERLYSARRWYWYETSSTIAYVEDQVVYSFPTDFRELIELKDTASDAQYHEIPFWGLSETTDPLPGEGRIDYGAMFAFVQRGTSQYEPRIQLRDAPTSLPGTFTLTYRRKPTQRSSPSDTPDAPDHCHQVIYLDVLRQYMARQEPAEQFVNQVAIVTQDLQAAMDAAVRIENNLRKPFSRNVRRLM